MYMYRDTAAKWFAELYMKKSGEIPVHLVDRFHYFTFPENFVSKGNISSRKEQSRFHLHLMRGICIFSKKIRGYPRFRSMVIAPMGTEHLIGISQALVAEKGVSSTSHSG